MEAIEGKVVVITGASSGIGEATARRLAQEGASVVLGARRADRLQALASELQQAGGSAAWCQADVTSRERVDALVQLARETFGPVDVLVNNAGLMPQAPLEQLRVDEWERMIDVNIKGVLYGIAAVLPQMKERGSGHVVNLGSVAGHVVFAGATVYCGTKFAVRAITEGLRQEAGPDVRVTLISPGVISTEIISTTTDAETRRVLEERYRIALPPTAVADAIAYAISQPADVDVNDVIIRPAAQQH